MEKYRTMFMKKHYRTELFSHYTINSLTWKVFKKYNPLSIKILDDYSIYSAFEGMKRGGLCGVGSSRYALANNKYMKTYDKNLPSSCIMHVDINGMYTHIMGSFKLPYNEFTFVTNVEIRDFNIWAYDENSDYGYILCMDISAIDISCHDYYSHLPLFSVKRKIYKKEISHYQKIFQILMKNHICALKN